MAYCLEGSCSIQLSYRRIGKREKVRLNYKRSAEIVSRNIDGIIQFLLYYGVCLAGSQWAVSSAGRAPRSQRGGRGFESPTVHHFLSDQQMLFLFQIY